MRLLYQITFILGLALGIPASLIGLGDPRWLLAGAGWLSLAAITSLIVATKRRVSPREPMNLFVLYVFIGTTLGAFAIAFRDSPRVSAIMVERDLETFVTGGLWAVPCLLLVSAGYILTHKRFPVERWLPKGDRLSERGIQFGVMIALAISLLATMSYVQSTGGLSAIGKKKAIAMMVGDQTVLLASGYTRLLVSLGGTMILVLLSHFLQQHRRLPRLIKLELAGLLLAAAAVPLISSSRGELMTLIISILFVYSVHRKISKVALIGGVAVALTVFGLMTTLRSAPTEGGGARVSNPLISLAESGNGFSVSGLSHIIAGVPERMEYKLGATYFSWITAPIPRSFWPAKPEVSLGVEIREVILQLPTKNSGRPPGLVGEGYINFGVIGMLGMALALGAILRICANSFEPALNSSSLAAPLYFILVMNLAALSNGNLSQVIVRSLTDCVSLFISFVLLRYIVARRSTRPPQPLHRTA